MLFVKRINSEIWRLFFFFNDTATTEIYTLSLHDALPIYHQRWVPRGVHPGERRAGFGCFGLEVVPVQVRSEEHTSELQSQSNLVCRLLLEKKKQQHRFVWLWRRLPVSLLHHDIQFSPP